MFRKKFFVALHAILLVCMFQVVCAQHDTLSVMYYNVLNFPGTTPERVQNFRTVVSYAKPDVLVISELISEEGADMLLEQGLNSGAQSNYLRAAFTNGEDSDNMLFYNSQKLILYSQDTIDTELRLINEYVLFYHTEDLVNTEDTTFLYFYSAHLKASQGTDNQQKRLAEIQRFQDHVSQLPYHENVIFGGDLNF